MPKKFWFFSTLCIESPEYAYHFYKALSIKNSVLYILITQNTLYLPYKQQAFSKCWVNEGMNKTSKN